MKNPERKKYVYWMLVGFGSISLSVIFFFLLYRLQSVEETLQKIVDILVDCDEDCVIYLVEQAGGAACHTGHRSCFYRRCDAQTQTLVETSEPVFDPEKVYHSKESASK